MRQNKGESKAESRQRTEKSGECLELHGHWCALSRRECPGPWNAARVRSSLLDLHRPFLPVRTHPTKGASFGQRVSLEGLMCFR